MFRYTVAASFNVTSGHMTTFEADPKLREEDIEFYGLIRLAASKLPDGFIDRLPGTPRFEYTNRDRGIARAALRAVGVRYEDRRTSLEVCTIRLDDPADLIASDFYTLSGTTKHGLEIMGHSTGVCTARQQVLRALDNRGEV